MRRRRNVIPPCAAKQTEYASRKTVLTNRFTAFLRFQKKINMSQRIARVLVCQARTGREESNIMSIMSFKTMCSTCRSARAAGLLDCTFAEQRVAALLGSVTQAVLAFLIHIDDCSSAWDGRKAPANAAGLLRPTPAVEGIPSGFSKPIRCLTEQRTS